jgi:glycosyltransferase involved in cell wall biosynthesis
MGTEPTPLRIVLIGDYPADPRLGSPKVLLKLREAFVALGHRVTLITREDLGGPTQRHARDLLAPWLAARRARAVPERADVIDASSAEGYLLARRARGELPAVVARSHGLEHLNYQRMLDDARHGLTGRAWHRRVWYPAVRLRLVAAAARRADRLIVLNETDRRFAVERRWLKADRIDVVPHGLSEAFLAASDPVPRDGGFLFCASWDRMKGIDYLAAAFERVARLRPTARLTVLGPGHEADTVLRAFAPDARARITVLPRSGEARVASECRRHLALVMCSTYEGFGMVVPEAMSQGLPVIATPFGAAATLVREGRTGLIVPPRDGSALATAMLHLLDHPELASDMGRRAAALVAGMTWAATADETLRVYRRAIAQRASVPAPEPV